MSIETIHIKRGLLADLPTLTDGELAFTKDTGQLWIGSDFAGRNVCLNASSVSTSSTSAGGTQAPPPPAPVIVSLSPATGTLTTLSGSITVTFSQAMGQGASDPTKWTLTTTLGTIAISGITATATTATISYTQSGITSGAQIMLTASAAIQSAAGASLTGSLSATYTYQPTFTVPTIQTFSPASGTVTTVPTSVQVTFSQAMGTTSLQNVANWSVSSTLGTVSIASVTLTGTNVATVALTVSGVDSGAVITLTAGTGIQDANGTHLGVAVSATYTYTPVTSTPQITSWAPASDSSVNSLPGNVVVTFNAPVATAASTPANWTLATSSAQGTAAIANVLLSPDFLTATVALNVSGVAASTLFLLIPGSNIPLTGITSAAWLYQPLTSGGGTTSKTYNPGRLYLASSGTPVYTPSTYDTTVYGRASNGGRTVKVFPMNPAPSGSALTTDTWTYQAPDTTGAAVCLDQWVAGPLTAQTLSGTVKFAYYPYEDQSSYEGLWETWNVKVVSPTGTVRGSQTWGPSGQIAPLSANRGVIAQSMTLTGITAQDGDYLVIEYGSASQSTTVATTLTTTIGDAASFDLAFIDGYATTNGNPWIEFESGITFKTSTAVTQGTTNIRFWGQSPGSSMTAGQTTMQVTFSAPMGASVTTAANWLATASAGTVSISSVTLVSGNTYLITFTATNVPTGAAIAFAASESVLDASGNYLAGNACASFIYVAGSGAPAGGGGTLTLPTAASPTTVSSSWAYKGAGPGGAIAGCHLSAYNALAFCGTDMQALFRSPDTGTTWWPVDQRQARFSNVLWPSGNGSSTGVSVAPDGATCYYTAAGRNPQKSTDQGLTWASMTGLTLASGEYVLYWVFDSYTTGTVFCGTSAGLWRTTDGGTTWSKLAGITGIARGTVIDYTGTSTRTYYHATSTGIQISSDAITWTSFYTGPSSGIRAFTGGRDTNGLTLAFTDTDPTAAAANGVDSTGDYGYVWVWKAGASGFAKGTQGGGLFLCMAENDSQTIWTTGGTGSSGANNYDAQIWVTMNAGNSWNKVFAEGIGGPNANRPWPMDKLDYNMSGVDIGWWDDNFFHFTVNRRNSAQAMGGNNFMCLLTKNTGAHWTTTGTTFAGGSLTTTTVTSPITGIVAPAVNATVTFNVASNAWATVNQIIYIGGWGCYQVTALPTGQITAKNLGTNTVHSGNNAAAGTAIMLGATVLSARMPQMTWSSNGIENTSCLRMKFNPNDATTCYAAFSDVFGLVSEDGGNSWRNLTPHLNLNCVYDFAFDPTNNNVVYAVGSSSHDFPEWNHFWTQVPGVANGIVMKSTDKGRTWTTLGGYTNTNGLPDIPCLCIARDSTRNKLYVGTQGLGVYVSSDDGASWTPAFQGLPMNACTTIFQSGTTFISQNSCTVWQIEIDSTRGDVYCLVTGNAGEGSGPNNTSSATPNMNAYSNFAHTGIYWLDVQNNNATGLATSSGVTAWQSLRGALAQPAGTTDTNLWMWPTSFAIDYGSRLNGLPQTLYLTDTRTQTAGNSSNICGLWKSTNRGGNWALNHQHTWGRHILIDPATTGASAVLFLQGRWDGPGSSLNGGAFKSTDGGTTWGSQITSFPTMMDGRGTVFDPNDSTKIFFYFFGTGILHGPKP